MRMSSAALLISIMISLSSIVTAKVVEHTSTIILLKMEAYDNDGTPTKDLINTCKRQFNGSIGENVTLNYAIDSHALKEKASVSLFDQKNLVLNAAGIETSYTFISNGFPHNKGIFTKIDVIIAKVDMDFSKKMVTVVFRGGKDYRCILSGTTTS
jgi:hypothetical protein